ncbi:hypothetical protein I4U23_011334 [Adineta vaga]|nr:hypothetical protein I4U23_011334 [Adineta vaga]
MTTAIVNEQNLRKCFEESIQVVQKAIDQIKLKKQSANDALVTETTTDENIYSFTLSQWEESFMVGFKRDFERIVIEQISKLENYCRQYFLDVLHQLSYDDEKMEFTDQFNISMLGIFARELERYLASIDGYRAAWNGEKQAVDAFLQIYPAVRDKSGLWGTTLLYSAARNGHLDLVRDLIEHHRCSVNAQNRQHILRALASSGQNVNYYDTNSKAGSTPLHGACYFGHLNVIKYLIDLDADYYIQNQAGETPFMHAKFNPTILEYIRELLVFGYSSKSDDLPERPIDDNGDFRTIDCIWEYKPFADERWFPFPQVESSQIQESLILESKKEFQREIYLNLVKGVYSICLMKFLRSGRNLNYSENLAWIRCRGSSFVNFNCYALWQIFLTKHPDALSHSVFDMINIPTSYDSRFEIHLQTWYFCNAQTNEQLDKGMKYHRRYVNIKVPFISDESLRFNLETFSFTDHKNTVQGHLRWVPKMISNNSKNTNEILDINEYVTMTNINPIPLTTTRVKYVPEIDEEKLFEPMDDENLSNENDDDPIQKTPDTPLKATQSLTGFFSIPPPLSDVLISEDEYVNEESVNTLLSQESVIIERPCLCDDIEVLTTMENTPSERNEKYAELQRDLDAKYEENVRELIQRIETLEQERKIYQEKQIKLLEISKTIRKIEYIIIQKQMMQDFLIPNNSLILNYLRQANTNIDSSFHDRPPKMMFSRRDNSSIVTLEGFQEHHDQFKEILKRIQTLSNIIQSAKDFYQRHLNRTMYSVVKCVLPRVTSQTQIWRDYVQLFSQLFRAKNIEYKRLFDDHIDNKLQSMVEQCILNNTTDFWKEIKTETDQFVEAYLFIDEVDRLKQKALDEFIKENISLQHFKFDSEPTQKSISVIHYFIEKVKKEFQTDSKYRGHEVQHFNLIPKLLERLMIHYSCFKIQLPLYESSNDLLTKIEDHVVTTISTSTGSGKSTLLPALLIAEGYDKVIVTQPRRLPCQLICKRVNETILLDKGSLADKLAGWIVSGSKKNSHGKVLYLTDGLLKERLLCDENLITNETDLNKSVVFFIDEVHERSVNIDLCLALLARLLSDKPELQTKVKVIVSSATLDASVPNLFRRLFLSQVTKFEMPLMGTRYPVQMIHRPKNNIIDVVQELCKKRKRHDQILCFVSSISEVNQCCRLIADISQGTIVAYPLIQSQHPNVQQANIEHGTLFFSTTVAETSLTFPSLKYVVDTGMINMPFYDIESKRTILKEVRAAESTLKQRSGRLGRTQPGEYYSLYSFQPSDVPYPVPQIRQSDLMNLEFSLRKSPMKRGLNYLSTYLPDSPSPQSIKTTIKQLQELDIVENTPTNQLTAHGKELAKLPDFSSLAMSKAVLAALKTYDCGHDLICLASCIGVLNTTTMFRSIPLNFKSLNGDFMTLLNLMNRILLVQQSTLVRDANIDDICKVMGLHHIQHFIKRVLKRYSILESFFNSSTDFRWQAQRKSDNWELIAKALLAGYSDNIFISMKDLQERTHHFVRYSNSNDIAVLDLQSTLIRSIKEAPVSIVLAKDIRRSTAVRATAILSFLGEVKPEWISYRMERQFNISENERLQLNNGNKFLQAVKKFFNRVKMLFKDENIVLEGSSGDVLNAEFHLRQQMISELRFDLKTLARPNAHENFLRNLNILTKMTRIFNPLIWRWKRQKQVDITINTISATETFEIIVQGRDSVNKQVKDEFQSFIGWLQYCAVICHPNSGLSPRVLRPQMRYQCLDIEERIVRVTDSKRTPIDLYNGIKGVNATRETRMEVVAWIAICKFDCRLEGGFVRDWIVGHYTARPTTTFTNPNAWIEYNGKIPSINKEVVPCDLDCHLPSHAYFDMHKFQDELYKYGITCSVERQDWKYVLLFDENEPTGPFTMDLVEPHIALAHDRIDFDVSNLTVEKDYTHELGMRIDIAKKPYSIELETIIENIKNKRFQLLRHNDYHMKQRIDKMINVRKWQKIDEELSVILEPHWKYHVVLVPLSHTAVLYNEIKHKMSSIQGLNILSIEEIRNPSLEETYEGMKKMIKKECLNLNPNEQKLFHGTKAEGIYGIAENGFDDRYYTVGMYGRGAYFADNPLKSHDFTNPDSTKRNTRVMFYSKVLIGKPYILTAGNNDLKAAPKDFHSVVGKHSPRTEYIVYRYGQALPYLKIIYQSA